MSFLENRPFFNKLVTDLYFPDVGASNAPTHKYLSQIPLQASLTTTKKQVPSIAIKSIISPSHWTSKKRNAVPIPQRPSLLCVYLLKYHESRRRWSAPGRFVASLPFKCLPWYTATQFPTCCWNEWSKIKFYPRFPLSSSFTVCRVSTFEKLQ